MAKRNTRSTIGDAPPATEKDQSSVAAALAMDGDEDTLVERTVTINRPRRELYEFWRDFRNLPLFMENIESVVVLDDVRSHWKVKAPAGTTVEWDSILLEDVPGETIAWSSAEGAGIANSGRIDFRESTNGRGTLVSATITYDAPAGKLGKLIATLFKREPRVQARHDLRRFKQLMETGEVARSDAPTAATRGD